MRLIAVFDEKNYKQRSGTVREAVRAIIVKDGKVALVKSLKENHYKFPGGGIESNESHIDTLIRETKEQLIDALSGTGAFVTSYQRLEEYGLVLIVSKIIKEN